MCMLMTSSVLEVGLACLALDHLCVNRMVPPFLSLLGCRYEEGWPAFLNPNIQTTTAAARKMQSKTTTEGRTKHKNYKSVTRHCFFRNILYSKYS